MPKVRASKGSRRGPGGLRVPKGCCSARGPKSARAHACISKLLVEKRPTQAHSDAPPEVHQFSVAAYQPTAGQVGRACSVDVYGGPLGLLSTKVDRQDVRMHSTRRRNETARKWNGFEAPTPTAGSRTRPRVACRAPSVLS